jgi:hypothetical protein
VGFDLNFDLHAMTERIVRRGVTVPDSYLALDGDAPRHHEVDPGILSSVRGPRRSS